MAKERIKLRTTALDDGRQSLYLDYVKDGRRVRERIQLYLLPETSNKNRAANRRTMKEAEAIRDKRLDELVLYDADVEEERPRNCVTLSEAIDNFIQRKISGTTKYKRHHFETFRHAVDAFSGLSVRLSDVDAEYCDRFVDFLRHDFVSCLGQPIRMTTARSIIYIFSSMLGQAVADGLIPWNPVKSIKVYDRITRERPARVFLTALDVRRLFDEPCPVLSRPQVKQAFLFSVFTGLTREDIITLKWKDIKAVGGKPFVTRHSSKNTVNLCPIALRWLPETSNHRGLVFKGLPKLTEISNILKLWQRNAEIEKPLTFSISRNTFAYLLLSTGSDILTASSLMGVKPKFLRPYLQMVDYVPPTQDERFGFLFQDDHYTQPNT